MATSPTSSLLLDRLREERPLVAVELRPPRANLSRAKSIDTVEFQLLEPDRSRTTWILVHDGKIYIPCGYLNSAVGRIWKKWPIEAEKRPGFSAS